MKEEHKLARGHLLATIPQLEKEWRVSFEFMANSFRGLGKGSKKNMEIQNAIRRRAPPHYGRTLAPEAIEFESPCRAHSET